MVNKFISKSKNIFLSPQSSILSAATLIMVMIIASRILGLVRQRALAHFFTASNLSLFFAAFRLPDTIFEILVFGTFSSAFIPVFTRLVRNDQRKAWDVAASVVNLGLIFFSFIAITIAVFAQPLYKIISPGFSPVEHQQIVKLTRFLFAAQGFFVISYVLTGVLESLKRFLVPALAPLFYNLGIIIGTIFLSKPLGLMGPVVGVLIGAVSHFLIQLPLAMKLGFRFKFTIDLNSDVKKIGKLALPRILEVSFLQLSKIAELFFSSLLTTASYTYYTFGNTLQLLPVGLFGTSIAKAALPTLASQSEQKELFAKTLWKSLYQMIFLIMPLTTILIVLRIPIVRLVYGTDIFTWEATVQTGMVVSAFALSIIFQASNSLLARGFYAMHDTKTPVAISVSSIVLIIIFDYIFIKLLEFPIWGLALAFSLGSFIQFILLLSMITKRINGGFSIKIFTPIVKFITAAITSGFLMFFLLKFFDQYTWVKRLTFLNRIEGINFEKFVLDTRYTVNLIVLTGFVAIAGVFCYIIVSVLLKTDEVWVFFKLLKRLFKHRIAGLPEKESVVPTTADSEI